jgi:hypothetical protein
VGSLSRNCKASWHYPHWPNFTVWIAETAEIMLSVKIIMNPEDESAGCSKKPNAYKVFVSSL